METSGCFIKRRYTYTSYIFPEEILLFPEENNELLLKHDCILRCYSVIVSYNFFLF
jgi:hypothetical protein